jgi:hypothetical protein
MSRSCWYMVVLFVLALFAGAEGKTTQAFLQQALVGIPAGKEVRTSQAQIGSYRVTSPVVAQLVVVDPMPQGPKTRAGLREVDLKQLVVMDQWGMIDVTEMPQAYAEDAIRKAGLRINRITYDYSDDVPAGSVISQDPQPDTLVTTYDDVNLVIAQTKLAIHRFPIERGIGGDAESYGQLIVHRLFDVELKTPIQNIPIFAIADKGFRHASVEARAQSIAENLLMAWGVLEMGGELEMAPDTWIMPDDEERWRLRGPFAPDYASFPNSLPAIYVRNPRFGNTPLRIMTVYPGDADLFGQPVDESGIPVLFSQEELAEYLVSLIQAHYTLLAKKSTQLEDFENLEICKTREGKIFKEICLRALDETRGTSPKTDKEKIDNLRSTLARVALSQRYRLLTLAFNAPRDWRLRD